MSSSRVTHLAIANFLTALGAVLAFKLALFRYAASGAEGQTSALLTYLRLVLCLGWDVVSAAMVATAVMAVAGPLARWFPTASIACSAIAQAIHGAFLLVSYHVAVIVGAPLDKAAIDLLFFYADPTPGGTRRVLTDSVMPYLAPGVGVELLIALALPPLAFVWILRRPQSERLVGRTSAVVLALLVFLTIVVVPGLANGLLAVHTFGLERSPVTLLVGSYVRGPWRAMTASAPQLSDPYCFDMRSPVPVDGVDPLVGAVPRRTNVLLVILESVGTRSLKPDPTPMPFLESLGRERGGVSFENHYTHWAQTITAAFSIWCSELPHPDYPPITYVNPAIPCVSLSEALKAAGYDTALFTSGDFAFDREIRFLKHRRLDVMIDRNDMPGRDGAWSNAWGIDERVTARAVVDWIVKQRGEHPERPFFATYNMAAGHHPYEYPGSPTAHWFDRGSETPAQRATLGFADDRLRDIVGELRRRQWLDSTLIAVVSDHGPGSGRPPMGQIRDASIYEGSVHVPFVIAGPQLRDVSGAVTLPTGHIDIAPTLLGLVGITPPATMKGRDLTRTSDGRLVIMATRPPLSQVGVRAGNWKLVHWQETGANELFDLARDPDERADVSSQHEDIVRSLDAIGSRWQAHSRNLIENYAGILEASGRRCAPASAAPARVPAAQSK